MSLAATSAEALEPVRADPSRSGLLLDIDGTLAPIVRHADDAHVQEATRTLLIGAARRYRLVACVTGRRASSGRQIVAIGTIAYSGNHGIELLRPGATQAQIDPEVAAWAEKVRDFAEAQAPTDLQRLRIRLEDKDTIFAFHWRGAPDEERAHHALLEVAERAQAAGLATHWGRKVLEVRPPVAIGKGHAVRALLRDSGVRVALYAGDDRTDLDAFAALRELVREGALDQAVCVAVASPEGPAELVQEADLVVEGTDGTRAVLGALL
ncbi:MAG TPA: trehalose-phosphatase [Solirubrobacteraceae bacterium]|nr:trehalose-phosphatase [Solirubrobacteraceae bacterium]